jgi:hypothetical protein
MKQPLLHSRHFHVMPLPRCTTKSHLTGRPAVSHQLVAMSKAHVMLRRNCCACLGSEIAVPLIIEWSLHLIVIPPITHALTSDERGVHLVFKSL